MILSMACYKIQSETELSKKIMNMMDAIADTTFCGVYDVRMDPNGATEVIVDGVDLDDICGWTLIIQRLLNERKILDYSFNTEGVLVEKDGNAIAFNLICDSEGILAKQSSFSHQSYDDDHDNWELYTSDVLENAKEALSALKEKEGSMLDLNRISLYCDEDDFDAAAAAF